MFCSVIQKKTPMQLLFYELGPNNVFTDYLRAIAPDFWEATSEILIFQGECIKK